MAPTSLNQLFAHMQTKPNTLLSTAKVCIYFSEELEKFKLGILLNSNSSVCYFNMKQLLILIIGSRDYYYTLKSEFKRVSH